VIQRILAGGIAGIPTDTVYGLAALATDAEAVSNLVDAKGREADQPIAVLFDSIVDILPHLEDPRVLDRIARLWPGALTVVVRAAKDSPIATPAVTAERTIGIRKPDDSLARSVIRAAGGVLAVTSANTHGEEPATTADEVLVTFGDLLPVLDGGSREGGVASTVVDLTSDVPRVLRQGAIDVSEVLGTEPDAPELPL
jgi:tRNA threonylcarbamoyl adenosine modification protein (Sua5/YciO/YrdC/YwlC family)